MVVTVPPFPNTNGLEAWGAALCRGLIAAAGSHGRMEIAWLMEVMNKTYDQLGDPNVEERFKLLDAPLATALMKTLPSQHRKRVATLESDALKQMKVAVGRQVAWMIMDWFKRIPTTLPFQVVKTSMVSVGRATPHHKWKCFAGLGLSS